MQRSLEPDRDLSEVPLGQQRPVPKSLQEYEQLSETRDDATAAAYASGDCTMKEIGAYFGLHYPWVSRVLKSQAVACGVGS